MWSWYNQAGLKPVVSADGAYEQSTSHVSPSSLLLCRICRPKHTHRMFAVFKCGCVHSCPFWENVRQESTELAMQTTDMCLKLIIFCSSIVQARYCCVSALSIKKMLLFASACENGLPRTFIANIKCIIEWIMCSSFRLTHEQLK